MSDLSKFNICTIYVKIWNFVWCNTLSITSRKAHHITDNCRSRKHAWKAFVLCSIWKIKKRQLFTSNLIAISPWLWNLGISAIVVVWYFGWVFLVTINSKQYCFFTKGTHGIDIEQTSPEAVEVRKLLRRGSNLFLWGGSGRFFDLFGIPWISKKIWNSPGKQQNMPGH